MLPILLVVLCSVAIAVILKINESRGGDRLVAAGANYVVAAILAALLAESIEPETGEIWFGSIVGGIFVGGFLLLMRGLQEIGLASPTSAARLSMLLPIVGSIVFFDEHPSGFQIAGIAAGSIAFALLGAAQRRKGEESRIDTRSLLLLTLIFLVAGISDFSMKIAGEIGLRPDRFILVVFAAAALYCWIAVAARRKRPTAGELGLGALLGVPNFFAAYFFLQALATLPAGLVYPAVSAGGVVGATAAGLLLWKERPTRTGWIGIGLAAVAVALLGMKGE
jgi:drug/metabolite transporter (DMT)-like permease